MEETLVCQKDTVDGRRTYRVGGTYILQVVDAARLKESHPGAFVKLDRPGTTRRDKAIHLTRHGGVA